MRDPIAIPDVAPLSPHAGFLELADAHAIAFDDGDLERLGLHLSLIRAVNEHTNLTAITDPQEMWIRHVFDSLTLLPMLDEIPLPETGAIRIIDVGSGAGLPGIPLAIARPDLEVTLLEATGKKAEFLCACAERLALANVRVVQARAEAAGAYPGGSERDRHDLVVTRAVGRLAVGAELCIPLAKVGALAAFIKGQKADEELDEARHALHLLHATHAATIDTPTGRIVVIQKQRPTPKPYPRRDGEPKRAPLGMSA